VTKGGYLAMLISVLLNADVGDNH